MVNLVVIFADAGFMARHTFETAAEARAFDKGYRCALGITNQGGAQRTYVLPGDEDHMREFETPEHIQDAIDVVHS